MTSTLKPCPFCGGQPELDQFEGITDNPVWSVMCSECLLRHPGHSTKREAIKWWNTRYTGIKEGEYE